MAVSAARWRVTEDVAKRLAADAEDLLIQMHNGSSDDVEAEQVLPNLLQFCRRIVDNDFVVLLLAMIQAVDRDPENDFAPLPNSPKAVVDMADAALLVLGEMLNVSMANLAKAGWVGK